MNTPKKQTTIICCNLRTTCTALKDGKCTMVNAKCVFQFIKP